MIPRTDFSVDASIPAGWEYWVPSAEERADPDGFGYFHDKWLIRDVDAREARRVIATEVEFAEIVGRLASDAHEFDDLAGALEHGDPDRVPDRLTVAPFVDEIDVHIVEDDFPPLEGLELGVAGLVYALSAAGCWTAASCRGHPPGGWAERPCVYVAAGRHRVSILQPLVRDAGCGFVVDEGRGQFLVVVAPSITETMTLAQHVMDARGAFVKPRRPRAEAPEDGQGGLW